jgi:predicted ester cyclase
MLGEDSHFKLYFEKLRQSPLPVVPFIGKRMRYSGEIFMDFFFQRIIKHVLLK